MAFENAGRDHEISPTASSPTASNPVLTLCWRKFYNKNRSMLMRIEVYVGVTAILLTFLVLFGSFRRRSKARPLILSTGAAFAASTYLVTYTMGQMQSVPIRNEFFAVWAVFLFLVLGNADSISAYSLEDNEHLTRFVWAAFVQSFWMGYLIGTYQTETKFKIPLLILWALATMKTNERADALAWASKSHGSVRNSKLIADYMIYEHTLVPADEVDPTCMKGYNYLVVAESEEKEIQCIPPRYPKTLDIRKNEVITVHKIWESEGNLLSSTNDPKNHLKDICLSYALYRLLRRRFAGFPTEESCQDKTWNFVRYGLLSDHEGDDYKRAFRVIETELAFLYDSFYTKYPVIFARGFPKYRFLPLSMLIVGVWIAAKSLHGYTRPDTSTGLTDENGRNVDVGVTWVIVIAILIAELVQFVLIYTSNWARVMLICKHVSNPLSPNCFVRAILCTRKWKLKPWARKLGQYSLIKSFNYSPSRFLYNSLTPMHLYAPKNGQKESSPIKLTAEVKKAITLSLKTNGKKLTNGMASLQRNGFANQFSWACDLETHTHVILVWHIATSLCEMSTKNNARRQSSIADQQDENFKVATALSKYCAYLVAFKPELLPDHAFVTECIFNAVVTEAREEFKGCKTSERKYEKMMSVGDHEQKTMKKGAVLGKMLMEAIQERELLWKVLAEFGAELMLFLAPSDNTTAHVENLASGGQFITHVWALLNHAGILQRSGSAVVLHA